jgi:glucose-6-phosphate isomerase
MQLPDEAISYQYQSLLCPVPEDWNPTAELKHYHFLSPTKLRELTPRLMQVRSQVAAERELKQVPLEFQPLDAGFIDLPAQLLDEHKKKGDASVLGRTLAVGQKLREGAGAVVILGIGGSSMGAKALFDALKNTYHNELPAKERGNVPRIYFEGNNVDNDTLRDLFHLLEISCVDPSNKDERWAVVVISKSGDALETLAAYRAIRREMIQYYGKASPLGKNLVVPITGPTSKLRDLVKAEGVPDDNVLPVPDGVGGRYSVFTPVGLLPAAAMDLDVPALLLGAKEMTRRFLDEPFERNPVLQYAGVNYLMAQRKPIRVLSIWSKKLETLGLWYDQLLAESLGKQGMGPTPLTSVCTRDLHSRGQQHQEGTRDKIINNLVLKTFQGAPIEIGMSDHNEDDLNQFNRKNYADLMNAALRGTNQAYQDVGRPTADLVIPTLSEYAMGQLMQMLMLATVVEGRLMGVNPYGQPGVQLYKRNMRVLLKEEKPSQAQG